MYVCMYEYIELNAADFTVRDCMMCMNVLYWMYVCVCMYVLICVLD